MPHTLRNPHSVLAALEMRPQDVIEVNVPPKASTEAWERVVQLARAQRVKVSTAQGRGVRPAKTGVPDESARMGLAEAIVKEKAPVSPEVLFQNAQTRNEGKGLWLALDSLQDPHNVGAIFRAAAFFGVQGIVMTQERSAPLTSTAYDVASGGVESVPFVMQTNLQRAFEIAKDSGLWILGSSEHAHDDISTIQRDRPWLLVLGNEEKGMRRLTEESCDLLCKVSPSGRVTSLNVSVAAGILISRLSG
jgi:23S rRNA (guanosine2251-2'-O)-methyltransferase